MATIPINHGVLLASSTFSIPACSFVVCLRFYTRRIQKLSFGVDDWLTVPALILVVSMQVTMIILRNKLATVYRMQYQEYQIQDRTALWPFELEEIPALGLTKLSLIYFFRRVFNTRIARWYSWITSVMIIVTIAWTLAFLFAFLFICGSRLQSFWKSTKAELANCVRIQELHTALAVSDVILDIIILSMSIPVVSRLKMSTVKQLGVAGIFLFGVLTVGASILRAAVFLQDVAERFNPDLDLELLVTSGIYWSMLEIGLGLIAANLVVISGLLVSRTRKALANIAPTSFKTPFSQIPSDEEQGTRPSDERRMWNGPTTTVACFAEFARAESIAGYTEELRDIHVTQTLKQTEDSL